MRPYVRNICFDDDGEMVELVTTLQFPFESSASMSQTAHQIVQTFALQGNAILQTGNAVVPGPECSALHVAIVRAEIQGPLFSGVYDYFQGYCLHQHDPFARTPECSLSNKV